MKKTQAKAFPLVKVQDDDLKVLNKHFNEIFREWNPRDLLLQRDFLAAYAHGNRENTLVAAQDGTVVAHAAARPFPVRLGGATLGWAAYGNVMTLPEHRGQGIATRINEALWGKLKKEGTDGIYISGGRGLYTRMGATPCGSYRNFEVKAAALARLRLGGLDCRPCRRSDIPTLIALHGRDANSFVRKAEDFQAVFDFGCAFLLPAKAWLVSRQGKPLAYALAGPSYHKRGEPSDGKGVVSDYAGSRPALLAAMPGILAAMGFHAAHLSCGSWDQEMIWLLESVGLKGSHGGVSGTHLIFDPARMMKRLTPYFEARLGSSAAGEVLKFGSQGKAGFELQMGRERHPVSTLQDLTRLVFGSEPKAWAKLLPSRGPLREALAQVFPLPFPVMGLNWM